MRITIPWGGISLIGGAIWLTMTDWPGVIGWLMVVWGVISLFLQILVVLLAQAALKEAKRLSTDDVKELILNHQETYKTNHGRRLPVKVVKEKF
jgi:hypothetical protein